MSESAELEDLFDDANGDLALGELDAAVEKYRRCTELDAEFFDGWHALGMALMKLGRYPEAIAAGLKTVELRPNDQLAWSSLSLSYVRAGMIKEAEAAGGEGKDSRLGRKAEEILSGAGASKGCHRTLTRILSSSRPSLRDCFHSSKKFSPPYSMSLFNSLLGSVLGGGDKTQMLMSLAGSLITNHSSGQGLNGLAQQFESAGLGHLMQSWVGSGANLPVTPEQIQQVLGNQFVQQFAQQHGIDLNTASATIAQILPQLVNHVTPAGQVPAQGEVPGLLANLPQSTPAN